VTAERTPDRAMVLAAGRGKRLAGLTALTPKPLLRVGGRPLIDLAHDQLAAVGISEIVVNVHHLGEQVEDHVRRWRPTKVHISREPELLDTGGGVARALRWLGINPFFVLNSDLVWIGRPGRALRNLAGVWHQSEMDVLLLVVATVDVQGYDGLGDFTMAADGRLTRRASATMAPFVFTGAQIIHPRAFIGAPEGRFSLNWIYDRAAASGRLFGLRHDDGDWIDAGTPERLHLAGEAMVHARQGTLW
jgi:N-acetyl-alpha-D-muramate 1-phosphate uridylyltransferase